MSAKQFTYIPQPECLSQVREDVNACLEDAGWEERQMDVSLALGKCYKTSSDMDLKAGQMTGQSVLILAHHRMS